MTCQNLVVAILVGGLLALMAVLVWRENERRYDAFRVSGCVGDKASASLGISQACFGARRLCRDAPPLLDWRHVCD
jgi:hypothetical protein